MGSGEQVVMTLRQIATLLNRPLATVRYWASRRGIKPLWRDMAGGWYPLDEFRVLHERRRQWRGRKS